MASIVLHAAVLTVLLHRREFSAPEPPPTIEVSIYRPSEPVAEATPTPSRPAAAAPPDQITPQPRLQQPRPDAIRAPFTLPIPGTTALPAAPGAGASGLPSGAGADARAPARPQPPPPAVQRDDNGERLRSLLRSAGCETGSGRLTARERERCQERFGAAAGADPVAPPKDWAARRRGDEARRQARKSLFDDNDSVAPRGSEGVLIGGGGGAVVGVSVPFGQPPKALPNIPASTLRGDDDALRPKRKPEPKPAQPPGG